MDYNEFVTLINRHVFDGDKRDLLRKIAEHPERYVGLFRPTKPGAKLLQNLLQSHEIRFGDAMESLVRELLVTFGYSNLGRELKTANGECLLLDQYFTDGKGWYYFVEQKVRDDHDSTKKRGQVRNFEAKLDALYALHDNNLTGIMYFVDPTLSKNRSYYEQELSNLAERYKIDVRLLYGGEFFAFLGQPDMWDKITSWLECWKLQLPNLPEINMDLSPQESFEEIRDLEIRHWRILITNDALWREGIFQALSPEAKVLRLLLEFFASQQKPPYRELAKLLKERIEEYYG